LDPAALRDLAIALGLGLLVGLQRERAASCMAGIRTFALITWLGAVTGMLAGSAGVWIVAAGLGVLGALVVVGHIARLRAHEGDSGITTEVAAVLMYVVGVLVVLGDETVAVVLTGGVALLLHWKDPLHAFARRIGESDIAAIMRFVLITLVILPVLPDEPMGPYGVLNPFHIWLMVVLIVGIGLGGYLVNKLAGPGLGPILNGALGGFVSSTATTAGCARRAAGDSRHISTYGVIIAIASSVVFARVLIEIAVAGPSLLALAWIPLTVTLGAALLGALLTARHRSSTEDSVPELANPAEIWPALALGGVYALVIVAVAFVRQHYGDAGVYSLSFVGGLTDVDALTLSMVRLFDTGGIAPAVAWKSILIACLANLGFKAVLVLALGPLSLARQLAPTFALTFGVGGALLFVPSGLLGG
jgi:uncharacterized membrane protein (DUF4010 family)